MSLSLLVDILQLIFGKNALTSFRVTLQFRQSIIDNKSDIVGILEIHTKSTLLHYITK